MYTAMTCAESRQLMPCLFLGTTKKIPQPGDYFFTSTKYSRFFLFFYFFRPLKRCVNKAKNVDILTAQAIVLFVANHLSYKNNREASNLQEIYL